MTGSGAGMKGEALMGQAGGAWRAVVGSVAWVFLAWAPVSAEEPSRCVPEGALAYGEVRDLGPWWEAFRDSPLAQEVRAVLQEQGHWASLQAQMAAFEVAHGFPFERLVTDLAGGRMAVAVRARPEMAQPGVGEPAFALLVCPRGSDSVTAMVPPIWEQVPDGEGLVVEESGTYRGVRCVTFRKDGEDRPAALRGDLLVVSNDRPFLEGILDCAAGAVSTNVGADPSFGEMLASVSTEPGTAAFVFRGDGDRIFHAIPWDAALGAAPDAQTRAEIENGRLFLSSLVGMTASGRIRPQGWSEARFEVRFDPARLPEAGLPGVTASVEPGEVSLQLRPVLRLASVDLPRGIPEGFGSLPAGVLAAGGTRSDFGAFLDTLREQVPAAQRDVMAAQVTGFARGLGIADPGRFVREALGPEIGFALLPGPVGEDGTPLPPRLVLWLQIRGEEGERTARTALGSLEGWLQFAMAMGSEPGTVPPQIEGEEMSGVAARVLRIPPGRMPVPLSPSWAVHGGRFWIASDSEALRRVLEGTAGGAVLAADPAFLEAAGRVEESPISLGYADLPAVARYLEALRPWAVVQIARSDGRPETDVASEFGAFLRILGHAGPVVVAGRAEAPGTFVGEMHVRID